VTQIDEEQLDLPMEEQDHQTLAFLSGEFNGAQLRWKVPEKYGFYIVDILIKVNYLLLSHDEFSILPDHPNLTYIYNPLSADLTPARHVVHKLQRWKLKMSVFSYRMKHVMGELNYWKDLMKRWRVGWIADSENKAHCVMRCPGGRTIARWPASLHSRTSALPTTILWNFPSRKEILLVQ
jgi:hypothetical protein